MNWIIPLKWLISGFPYMLIMYGPGDKGAAVLLPGFAIK